MRLLRGLPQIGPNMAWEHQAACAGEPTIIFFPPVGAPPPTDAKAICRRCPVRLDCLDYALLAHIRDGVWGGQTPKERRAEGKRRRIAQIMAAE
jgi:WhiB family redox-sensing transcriptional regulator